MIGEELQLGLFDALGNDEGDVVKLLGETKTLHLVNDRPQHVRRGRFAMTLQLLDQSRFSELLAGRIAALGHAVRVKR